MTLSVPRHVAAGILRIFDPEMELLRRTLERVPERRLGWRPHPEARSIDELAVHLARIPGWVESMLVQDGYDLAGGAGEGHGKRRDEPATKEGMLALFDANRVRARAAIAARSDAELNESWRLERSSEIILKLTRAEALSIYVLDHAIHHRGQLTVYLRLLDVPVPALYGSSSDEFSEG